MDAENDIEMPNSSLSFISVFTFHYARSASTETSLTGLAIYNYTSRTTVIGRENYVSSIREIVYLSIIAVTTTTIDLDSDILSDVA